MAFPREIWDMNGDESSMRRNRKLDFEVRNQGMNVSLAAYSNLAWSLTYAHHGLPEICKFGDQKSGVSFRFATQRVDPYEQAPPTSGGGM